MKLVHYDMSEIMINEGKYSFEHFLKVHPTYSAPFGFCIRVYEKGVRHYASDGSNTIYLPLNDPYCDAICNGEGELARLLDRLKNEQEQ